MEEEYIAGVFVRKEIRSKGTGKALLDYVKEIKRELTLHVYVKMKELSDSISVKDSRFLRK